MQTMNDRPILPDWTRWAWASLVEREWWAPLFSRASTAYVELERLSVAEGIRPAAYLHAEPDDLVRCTEWAREHGILCIPITTTAKSMSYSATAQTPQAGQPFTYRILYVRPEHYAQTKTISDATLGSLLGYPLCCREAFDATWGRGQVDSTWEQTREGVAPNGPPEASTLFRWMGARLVSHMPCHYECEDSVRIGQEMFQLGIKYGYREEVTFIRQVLNWPISWSRLFGIAELVAPPLKISTRSDWTPEKQEFTRLGLYTKPAKTWWTENGFSSAESMRDAHRLIINTLVTVLPPDARVLDLGCGNGELLRRLKLHRSDITVAGVDLQGPAIGTAMSLSDASSTFWYGKIQDGQWRDWNATAVLYTPGRLLEMSEPDAATVRDWLSQIPLNVVYSYADWAAQGDLTALCAKAHLSMPVGKIKTPILELGVLA